MTKTTTILGLGFTGTFGHAFTKYILKHNQDTHIRIFSRDEYKQYTMAEEFNHDTRLSFMLGDIRDRERVDEAMQGVDVVIHAAALKQVPALEKNPIEAKKTNIDGTINVIHAAGKAGVKKAILISTDKAVHPINTYGVTKAMAERLWVNGGGVLSQTMFAVVRYGNVLGSRGSVIELWKKQAELAGEITITAPNMTRFLLMPSQAAAFVWQTLDRDNILSGSLIVPYLPTTDVARLARAVVPNLKQRVIGARMGEKLHEELLTAEEYSRSAVVGRTNVDGIPSFFVSHPSISDIYGTP